MAIKVGTVGLKIVAECEVDITGATVKELHVRKPNGKRVVWTAQEESATQISYVTQAGDLNRPGEYVFESYVEAGSYKGHGDEDYLEVEVRNA